MAEQIVVTKEGKKKLEDELEFLVTVRRKEITEAIKQARDYGDLSENSEYDEAMNEQAVVEARITQLDNMLKNCIVSDHESDAVIGVGSKVTIERVGGSKAKTTLRIVGPTETDPLNKTEKKISYQSPIGVALMGKAMGDKVVVAAPAGDIKYKILSVEK